jgi:hypothetical protein
VVEADVEGRNGQRLRRGICRIQQQLRQARMVTEEQQRHMQAVLRQWPALEAQ